VPHAQHMKWPIRVQVTVHRVCRTIEKDGRRTRKIQTKWLVGVIENCNIGREKAGIYPKI
jgi:hypothetical protein